MLKTKTFWFQTLLLVVGFFVVQGGITTASAVWITTYEEYTKGIDAACYDSQLPWNSPTADGTVPQPLITITRFNFPDIYDSAANSKFSQGIETIKGEKTELMDRVASESQYLPLASQIEKASTVYKERMSAIYACAVLNTRLKIHERLIKTFQPQGSNIVSRFRQSSDQIRSRISERSCRNVSDTENQGGELSLKKSLIRDTTLEYCNYRHYLSYVDYSVKRRLSDVIKAENETSSRQPNQLEELDRFPTTELLASAIASTSVRAENEIAQTRIVFEDAFTAYADFERNYASHVLMVLIEDRYQLIREHIRQTMNPIWQVIYQASNATSPGK